MVKTKENLKAERQEQEAILDLYKHAGDGVMSKTSNRMGFLSWLTLLFIGLKLTGFIFWPWVYVIAPMIVLIILRFLIVLVQELNKNQTRRKIHQEQ